MEAYYYNQLDKSGQAAYHAMLTGLRAIAPAFPVPRLELGQLSEIFLKLREKGLDIPIDVYTVPYAVKTIRRLWQQKQQELAKGGDGSAS